MIDSHIHIWDFDEADNLVKIADAIGAERVCIASVVNLERIDDNPALYAAKAQYPNRFHIFPGLDHAAHFSGGAIKAPSLAEQVDIAMAIGADGIKLLETKPDRRKWVDIPIDSDYYEAMFAKIEQLGIPVLWHVADPEEFWDPETTPRWARDQGWGYDETFTPWAQFYREVEKVLERHPRLSVTFAHFFFLSADLPRAAALFDRYPGIHFDLTPGIEMLYNMSKNVAQTREFFLKYSDRIIYGTDIEAGQAVEEASIRAGIVKRWLETDDEYRIPNGADYLLGPAEDGIMRGLKLPGDVLEKIYTANFSKMVGSQPKQLNRKLAAEECDRLAKEIKALGKDPASAINAAQLLRK